MSNEPIHEHFGLSYASYLVLPRSVLQSMPVEWQENFVKLLDEISEEFPKLATPAYRVSAVGDNNKFITDPYGDYERGRRRITKDATE